ncbi:replication initiator [uncultured Mobiluncus sp.]|uniref:replication initiator n=1 Tax=uncultured Mobiluncus sp. TaxID=293425 RepID=UPI00261BED3B|nr:replication initiator [uncultured Mobiluncus sp.]
MYNNEATKAAKLFKESRQFCSCPHIYKGQFYNCNSRFCDICPRCALLYRKDWLIICKSGCVPWDDIPQETIKKYTFYFLTLTAPSFGEIHFVPNTDSGSKVCACGKTHTEEDLHLKGVPVDPSTYDYEGQVAWNYAAAQLWRNTYRALRNSFETLDFFRVWEWQSRGALHVHVILRIEASEGVMPSKIKDIAHNQHTGEFGWGDQIDCQPLPDDNEREDRTKYLIKAVSYSAKTWGRFIKSRKGDNSLISKHYRRLDKAARKMECPKCVKGEICTAACHDNFGSIVRIISNSRKSKNTPGWSLNGTNRKLLRQRRHDYYVSNYDWQETQIGMGRAKKARQALANLSSSPQDIAARFANITARYYKPGTTRPGTRNHRSKPALTGLPAPF